MQDAIRDPASESRVRDNVRYYTSLGAEAVEDRLRELDTEWGLERALTAGLAGLGAFGLVMGLFGSRTLRLLTWVATPLLFAFSIGKWAPSAELTARRGLRTRKEIEEERYALKAWRGDFQGLGEGGDEAAVGYVRKADRVLDAVKR
jgi:hypothetical protein